MSRKPVVKCIFLGNCNVGKTSLLWKIIREQFGTVTPTISVQFFALKRDSFDFHIWDTAGQERFQCFLPLYLRDTQIIFFVAAVNDSNSIDAITNVWIKTVLESYNELDFKRIQPVLIYNKCDLIDNEKLDLFKKNEVLSQELLNVFLKMQRNVHNFCDSETCLDNIPIFYTSAKDGTNVHNIFNVVENLIIERNLCGKVKKTPIILKQPNDNNDTIRTCNC